MVLAVLLYIVSFWQLMYSLRLIFLSVVLLFLLLYHPMNKESVYIDVSLDREEFSKKHMDKNSIS